MESQNNLKSVAHSINPAPTPLSSTVFVAAQTGTETHQSKGDKTEQPKRFIPEHKKPDAALTFPEKMMNLMNFADKEDPETFCVTWLPDGKSFVIRNPDEFTRKVLPKFFKATKFSSFTRKLYRWGFRQVNRGIGPDDPIIFGNEYFQRDNQKLMTKMRSITAASARKQEQNCMQVFAQKRALESMDMEQNQKRMLMGMNEFMKQQAAMSSGMFPNNGPMNLTQALRPTNTGFGGLGRMDMFQQFNNPSPMNTMNALNSMNPMMSSFSQGGFGGFNGHQNQQGYVTPTSTADIVNAAINALRYAP